MILHLYFARRFARAFVALLLLFFGFAAIVDLVEVLRDFSDTDVSFGQIVELVLLKTPRTINQILPLITLLATIILFLSLARSSELVVTRAAGRSAIRSLAAPVTVALLVGLVAVSTLGPVVAAFSNRFAKLSDQYRAGGSPAFSISAEGLWLRQGDADGQSVISATRSNADASTLYNVTFLTYAPDGGPLRRIEAESAALTDEGWTLRKAKDWPLVPGTNPEAEAQEYETLELPSSLTAERIRESLGSSAGISIWEMRDHIAQLEQAGFSARRHIVWFQQELSRPLFLVAMVLIGAAFTMRHTRFGGTGPSVLAAVLLGFALYFARSFASILGENGQLAAVFATWSVPVAGIFLAAGLILHAEDG